MIRIIQWCFEISHIILLDYYKFPKFSQIFTQLLQVLITIQRYRLYPKYKMPQSRVNV